MKYCWLIVICVGSMGAAQAKKSSSMLYRGIAVAGYVDDGAYLNFTGPGIGATFGESERLLGLMPSLRLCEDRNTPKNPFVIPTLGLGLTFSYQNIALQLPLYYRPKNATDNGAWLLGFGIGLHTRIFNRKSQGVATSCAHRRREKGGQ